MCYSLQIFMFFCYTVKKVTEYKRMIPLCSRFNFQHYWKLLFRPTFLVTVDELYFVDCIVLNYVYLMWQHVYDLYVCLQSFFALC